MNLDNLSKDLRNTLSSNIYSYTDGSNNSYYISKNEIEYDPISPMMSNTGEYDAGPPAKNSITKEALEEVRIVFEKAALDVENHLENRPKGSGTATIEETGHTFVLKMGAASKRDIENLLEKLLGRD